VVTPKLPHQVAGIPIKPKEGDGESRYFTLLKKRCNPVPKLYA